MSETTHNSEDYAYEDQTKEASDGITADVHQGDRDVTSAEVNPAYYPPSAKPEALHNEAEKAGSEVVTNDPAAYASGEDSDGEDLSDEDQEALVAGAPSPVAAGTGASQAEGGSGEGDDDEGDELDKVLAGNVADVEAHALDHPEQAQTLLKREQEGQNRTTLTPSLESVAQAHQEQSND